MPAITPDDTIEDAPRAEEFTPPPAVHYYETGPITERMIERDGRLWAVTFHARHDGIGWRVHHTTIRPEEAQPASLVPGHLVDITCKVQDDQGPDVQLRVETPHYCQSFWVKRSAISRIHRP